MGTEAGLSNLGNYSIAIGHQSGRISQGGNSVAIGAFATAAANGSIVINSTGLALRANVAGLVVAPVRGVAGATPVLVYNATTREITYNSSTRRIKENIIDLTANTAHIYDVRPVEYDMISGEGHFLGFIAEEVYDVDPHFAWMLDGQPEGIEWFNMLTYTIAELKKLKTRLTALENNM
ncbi:Chlorovirus glycoprotein repeat domain-containing protein [Acanthocystis turfacea Chlorella virus WI0606]|nr:Chlorovirus glycoprotein repeat domain-containing protein [Acanthocystis turfacea Chlorella virus WI0606]